MSIGKIDLNSSVVGGFIESVSTISGAKPPNVGTLSLFTKLLTIIVTLTISIGTRITQSMIPITVRTLFDAPLFSGPPVLLSAFKFIHPLYNNERKPAACLNPDHSSSFFLLRLKKISKMTNATMVNPAIATQTNIGSPVGGVGGISSEPSSTTM